MSNGVFFGFKVGLLVFFILSGFFISNEGVNATELFFGVQCGTGTGSNPDSPFGFPFSCPAYFKETIDGDSFCNWDFYGCVCNPKDEVCKNNLNQNTPLYCAYNQHDQLQEGQVCTENGLKYFGCHLSNDPWVSNGCSGYDMCTERLNLSDPSEVTLDPDCLTYFKDKNPNDKCNVNEIAVKETCAQTGVGSSNYKVYTDCFDLTGKCGDSGSIDENHGCKPDSSKDEECVISKSVGVKSFQHSLLSGCVSYDLGIYTRSYLGSDDLKGGENSFSQNVTIYPSDKLDCSVNMGLFNGNKLGASNGSSIRCTKDTTSKEGFCYNGGCVVCQGTLDNPRDLKGVVGGSSVQISSGQIKSVFGCNFFCGDQEDYIKIAPLSSGTLKIDLGAEDLAKLNDLDFDLYLYNSLDLNTPIKSISNVISDPKSLIVNVIFGGEYILKLSATGGIGTADIIIQMSGGLHTVFAPGKDSVEEEFDAVYSVKNDDYEGGRVYAAFMNSSNYVVSCGGADCSKCRDSFASDYNGCKIDLDSLGSSENYFNFFRNNPKNLTDAKWYVGSSLVGTKVFLNTDFLLDSNYPKSTNLGWNVDKWQLLFVGEKGNNNLRSIYDIFPFEIEARGASKWWNLDGTNVLILEEGDVQTVEYRIATGPSKVRRPGGKINEYKYLFQVRNGHKVLDEHWKKNLSNSVSVSSMIYPETAFSNGLLTATTSAEVKCSGVDEANIVDVFIGGDSAPCDNPKLKKGDAVFYSSSEWCLLSRTSPLNCTFLSGSGGSSSCGGSCEGSKNAPTVGCGGNIDSPDPVAKNTILTFNLDGIVDDDEKNTLRVFACSTSNCGDGLSPQDLLDGKVGSTILASTICAYPYEGCSISYLVSDNENVTYDYYFKAVESNSNLTLASSDGNKCGTYQVNANTSGPIINSFSPQYSTVYEGEITPTDFLLNAYDPDGSDITYELFDSTFSSKPKSYFKKANGDYVKLDKKTDVKGDLFVSNQNKSVAVADFLFSREEIKVVNFPYESTICVRVTDNDGSADACAKITVVDTPSLGIPSVECSVVSPNVVGLNESVTVDYIPIFNTYSAKINLYENKFCKGLPVKTNDLEGSDSKSNLSFTYVPSLTESQEVTFCLKIDDGTTKRIGVCSDSPVSICTSNCDGVCVNACGSQDPDCGPDIDSSVSCEDNTGCCQIGCGVTSSPNDCGVVLPISNITNNLPPVAVGGEDIYEIVSSGETVKVELSGEKSFDPDGEVIEEYEWKRINKDGTVKNFNKSKEISEELGVGSYVFELTVKDKKGKDGDQTHVDKDTVYVTVIEKQVAVNTPESNPLIAAIVVFFVSVLIFSRKVGKNK